MKHTPGPWTETHLIDEDCGCVTAYVKAENTEITVFIADCPTPAERAECIANAVLTAAAPDLLRELQAIIELAEKQIDRGDKYCTLGNADLASIRATIKKTEGDK